MSGCCLRIERRFRPTAAGRFASTPAAISSSRSATVEHWAIRTTTRRIGFLSSARSYESMSTVAVQASLTVSPPIILSPDQIATTIRSPARSRTMTPRQRTRATEGIAVALARGGRSGRWPARSKSSDRRYARRFGHSACVNRGLLVRSSDGRHLYCRCWRAELGGDQLLACRYARPELWLGLVGGLSLLSQ